MNLEKINRILQLPVSRIFCLSLLAYLLLPTYLSSASYLCESSPVNLADCLDSSWVLSLNWAIQKNLIFGKDYVFTYGALGFLSTRNTLGLSPYYLLAFDLFVIGNLVYILNYALRRFANLQSVILAFVIVYTMASAVMYHEHIVFILWLISIFWLHHFLKHQQLWNLILPVLTACLLFYIKVNSSFVSLAVFYGYLVYYFFATRNNKVFLVFAGSSVPLFIYLLSFPLRTDIPGYIISGFSLIDGYNDAMNLNINKYLIYFILAVLILVCVFANLIFKGLKKNFVLLFACLLFSYVLYKQSFVRLDLHIIGFYALFPAVCGVIAIFYDELTVFQMRTIAVVCVFCLGVGWWLNIYPAFLSRTSYFADILAPNSLQKRYEANFSRFEFSPEVKNIIGGKTVDIIPWNISALYFNRANYDPRPVVQSYTAYTPYLSQINGQKYESESAPEIVILSEKSIDGRYAFFDDSDAKLRLIKNYKLLGLYNSLNSDFLMFQKNNSLRQLGFSSEIEDAIEFNEEYPLKDSNKAYFFKIDIEYNLPGKAFRLLYKPFPIIIVFTLENGVQHRFKAIPPILKNGVVINPFIENEQDLFNFYNNLSADQGKRIKSFRFEMNSPKAVISRLAINTYMPKIKLLSSEISVDTVRQ